MAHLEITDLHRWYEPEGPPVLAGIDLTVDDDLVVLVGASGSGKTTLLRCVAGLERPDVGEVRIAGEDVRRTKPQRRGVAYVTQGSTLLPHLTVEENLRFPLRMRRMDEEEQVRRVRATARQLGLEDLFERHPVELAAGQAQAVAAARQLTRVPAVFLFDEPLGNVDPHERHALRQEIRLMQRGFGVSMLYATNDPEEAVALADRLAVLEGGRLAQVDDPRTVRAEPASLAVAHLTSPTPLNVLQGEAEGDSVTVPGHGHLAAPGLGHRGSVRLAIRAEELTLEPAGGSLALAVDVDHVAPLGPVTVIDARGADGTSLTAQVRRGGSARAGEPAVLHAPLERIHVFEADSGRALRHGLGD